MAKVVGYQMRVKINAVAYRAKRVEVDDTVVDLEVGDSEDGRFETHEGGRAVARITIENATWDPADNPLIAPYNLEAGQHVAIEVYPAGLAEDNDDFPDVLITSAKRTGDVAQLQPFTITGVTSGTYTMAGT